MHGLKKSCKKYIDQTMQKFVNRINISLECHYLLANDKQPGIVSYHLLANDNLPEKVIEICEKFGTSQY